MTQAIKIADGIDWTPEAPNAKVREWITTRMGEITPEKDKFGRPCKWVIRTDTATVTVTRKYIRPGAWAKDRDIITVEKGGEE